MKTYPPVLTECETLTRVEYGASLARYGDGEFVLAEGRSIPCQAADDRLCARLKAILLESGACMVGIPNLEAMAKRAYWQKYRRCATLLSPSRRYASAFITRPDSAPYINTPEYWDRIVRLWAGRDVTLVRGGMRSLTADEMPEARSVREVIGPRRQAWTDYDALLCEIGTPDRALLCLGPTATVLAVDLCARGVHAIDLGHVGMWLRKYRQGVPMVKTDADSLA